MSTENTCNNIQTMPMLALRGISIFPGMMLNFDVGRQISINAVEQAMITGSDIFLLAQKDILIENPPYDGFYNIGVVCNVLQMLKTPEGGLRIMVEGLSRARLGKIIGDDPYFSAEVELLDEPVVRVTERSEAMMRICLDKFEEYSNLSPMMSMDIYLHAITLDTPGGLSDYIAQNIPFKFADKEMLLGQLNPNKRLEQVIKLLETETGILRLDRELREKMHDNFEKSQREGFIREQIRLLHDELGEENEDDEYEAYRKKIKALKLPEDTEKKLLTEVTRLSKQPFGSSESSVIRNYLDVCLELPWNKYTEERVNVIKARKVLDDDHYGLEKVKDRIIEFLAVKQLSPELKSPIICLVGPPGVGKTSIAMSVARATNRKLARLSLGGVHDEAEIRGHRKTYVGAMPGRIINAVTQAGSMNPLLLLDEIDKLGSDYRGDPSAALLEALDSEQNNSFRDHFLEIPVDLSNVFFITTANTTSTIPSALLDRMEVIEIGSYTDEEKLQIAKRHLLPKERGKHGLTARQIHISDDAIREICVCYAKESGVRLLEREIAALCRKAARAIAEGKKKNLSVTVNNIEEYLGPRKYKRESMKRENEVGLVRGLAWTSVGGEMLDVEVNAVEGTGKLELTGNLGDVMKESARAALAYIRSRASKLGIDPDFYKNKDIHINFPEGAVPKDGPSAGITMTVAIISALTGAPVYGDVAMTGEITIRGRVLAIGGLREKTMAAYRSGVKTVIIPADNTADLEEIDRTVRAGLRFVPTDHVDKILDVAMDFSKVIKPEKVQPLAEETVSGTNTQTVRVTQ